MAHADSSRLPARDRILSTASKLFYQYGTQSVGIDRIIAESGVAKMSLYNHFKSKDALIAAWLQAQSKDWRAWFQSTVERLSPEPKGRPLAVFDALQLWFEQPEFRGCPFINATVELVDSAHPAQPVMVAHREAISSYLLSLVEATEVSDAGAIAQQLIILFNGSIVVALMQGDALAAKQAKQIAISLLPKKLL